MVLVEDNSKVLIQGITGRSGQQVAKQLLDYKVQVVGGVTPGKGGQEVFGVPVFNSVEEAIISVGKVDVSMIYVPPLMAKDAALEAINAGIGLVHIFVEKVPILDTSIILSRAQEKGVKVLGPSSVGLITPGKVKIGSIGGDSPNRAFSAGNVGVISRSGGMTSEISLQVKNAGYGVSTAIGIGGDLLIGLTLSELLPEFEKDADTKIVVAFGEVGGSAEIEAANLLKDGKFTKPLIVYIAGKFSETLPKGTALGHAGAIVGFETTLDEKKKILKDCGAIICEDLSDLGGLLKQNLNI